MKYTIQYSTPKNKIAISDWYEYSTQLEAKDSKEALEDFNKSHQHLGTWLILDIWKDQT